MLYALDYYLGKAKKKNCMSQSCCAQWFFGAHLIQQNSSCLIFFACLIGFFSVFYELACQKKKEKEKDEKT